MSHARVALFAALLGFALNGPADPFRLAAGLQVWLSSVGIEEGGIMDPNGKNGAQGEAGSIMDPNG